MKQTAQLDALFADFLATFAEQRALRKSSGLSDGKFDKMFRLYVDVENPYRLSPYRESNMFDFTSAASQKRLAKANEEARLKAETKNREKLKSIFASCKKKFKLERAFLESIFAKNAEMFTRLRAIMKRSKLSAEKFMDALAEYQRRQLFKPKVVRVLTLETAKTVEEHLEMYRRHGVCWWWKTKDLKSSNGKPQWETTMVKVKKIINGRVYHGQRPLSEMFYERYEQSAFRYELKARLAPKGKKLEFTPWSFLSNSKREELANECPATPGEWDFCVMTTGASHPPPDWLALSNIPLPPNLYVHPHASIERLEDELRPFVKDYLRRLGITPRKSTGRPLQWKWLELLDRKRFDEGLVLNSSERGSLSDARKWAKARV